MAALEARTWDELDEPTRRELDDRYLAELRDFAGPELTADGVRVYLDYRHERPGAAITTYEEGQIKKMLRPYLDRSKLPDPVELEEHTDPLEVLGARKLHMTNAKTYVTVMVVLTLGFLFVLFYLVL